jgi:hypothetical protein
MTMLAYVNTAETKDQVLAVVTAIAPKFGALGTPLKAIYLAHLPEPKLHLVERLSESIHGIPHCLTKAMDHFWAFIDDNGWPERFYRAIPIGANLAWVWPEFLEWSAGLGVTVTEEAFLLDGVFGLIQATDDKLGIDHSYQIMAAKLLDLLEAAPVEIGFGT